jgi:hypothetical protein
LLPGRRRGLGQDGTKATLIARLARCDELLRDLEGVDDSDTRRNRFTAWVRADVEQRLATLSVPFDRNATKAELVELLVSATDPAILAMNPHRCVVVMRCQT